MASLRRQDFPAPRPMASPQVVLLTPLESSHPQPSPSGHRIKLMNTDFPVLDPLYFHTFTGVHFATPLLPISYRNGGGCTLSPILTFRRLDVWTFIQSVSSLPATTLPASVANKRLTTRLNPLDATFTEKQGVGGNAEFLKWNFNYLFVSLTRHAMLTADSNSPAKTESITVPATTAATAADSRTLPLLTTKNLKLAPTRQTSEFHYLVISLHHYFASSIQSRHRTFLRPPAMQIVHRNIQIDLSARRLDANYQSFRVRAARQPRFVHVNFRRKHFENEIPDRSAASPNSDDHVRQFANRFFRHLLAGFDFRLKLAGHFPATSGDKSRITRPFNVALDGDERQFLSPRRSHPSRGPRCSSAPAKTPRTPRPRR